MVPIFQYTQEKVYPIISETWSLAWHLGETARVIKAPTDDVLAEVLQDAGFEVIRNDTEGQIKFSSGPWTATLFNEGYRVKLLAGFKGTAVTVEGANKWNRRYMYTQMYLDQEGDPILQSYMYLGQDGVSQDALTGFCRMYGNALDAFARSQLKEVLSRLLDATQGRPTDKKSEKTAL